MDERELQQLFEKLQQGIDLTDDELRKLGRGTSEFGKNLRQAGIDVTKTMGSFARGLAEGATDFKALNPVIDGVTGALGDMAKAIPFAGNAVAGALKLVAEGSKFLIEQLQQATTSFQEISKIGGLTATGMSGLREQFLRSGQTLQGFQRTVTANAEALARFRGTVGQGAEDFSKIVGGIVDSNLGDELRRIGFTADEIGEATAAYIGQQSRLGISQNKTQAQLIAGSKKYAEELDILARLTGQSREELQKQQDAALSEARFRAEMDDLAAQGREEDAKALLDFQSRFAKLAPDVSQGIRDSLSNVTSEAATQLFVSTGGASREILDRLKAGVIDQDQATRELQAALRDGIQTQREYAKAVGDGTGAFIKYNQVSDVVNATLENGVLIAKKTQEQQQEGTDDLTNKTVDAQKSLEQMGRNLNNMAFQTLPAASKAVQGFTGVLNKAVAAISTELGIKPVAVPGGAGATGGGGAAGGGGGAGATGSRSFNASGIRPYQRFMNMFSGGPTESNWTDYIDFTENSTGSLEHFRQLEPHVQEAFANMARDYNNLTGKKLQVNSAFRSAEEQAAINPGANPKAAPGMSLHNKGRAIDIQSEQAAYLSSSGLLDHYGFKSGRAFNDPPHIYMRDGGIAAGPKSGYAATLHGTEAVVPLPDGKTIPVTMPGYSDSMSEQLGVMGAQLMALENLVAIMRDQTSISTKILQAANN